jgi:hypothetical protein
MSIFIDQIKETHYIEVYFFIKNIGLFNKKG